VELEKLLADAASVIKGAPVVKTECPCLVIGDLHGDPTGVNLAEKFGGSVIFLGDYADRGRYQRRTLEGLLRLFLKRDNIVLLRGNHEPGPPGHLLHTGRPFPYDVALWMTEKELGLYEELHVKLPLVACSELFTAVHGFLDPAWLPCPKKIPKEYYMYAVWSDPDPLDTSKRGIPPPPWSWRDVSHLVLRGHTPQYFKEPHRGILGKVITLFAHAKKTGGYYSLGVRYAIINDDIKLFENIPAFDQRGVIKQMENYFKEQGLNRANA